MDDKWKELYVNITQIMQPWIPDEVLSDVVHLVMTDLVLLWEKRYDSAKDELIDSLDIRLMLEAERERADRNEKALVNLISMYRDIVEITRSQEQYEKELKQLENMEKSL